MWRMDLLDEYDFVWSLDTDAFLLGPLSYDVFALMAARNASYGYVDVNVETPEVAPYPLPTLPPPPLYPVRTPPPTPSLPPPCPRPTPELTHPCNRRGVRPPLPPSLQPPTAPRLPPIARQVASGLADCIADFVDKLPPRDPPPLLSAFCPPPAHRWDGSKFYTNFQLARVSWARSEAYGALFDHVDRAGGIYRFRWGADPFMFLAATLTLAEEEAPSLTV